MTGGRGAKPTAAPERPFITDRDPARSANRDAQDERGGRLGEVSDGGEDLAEVFRSLAALAAQAVETVGQLAHLCGEHLDRFAARLRHQDETVVPVATLSSLEEFADIMAGHLAKGPRS